MFRTIGDRPSPWESLLPPEVLRLPEDLARVDALLDDPVFFAPFAPYFHPVLGRPGTPPVLWLPGALIAAGLKSMSASRPGPGGAEHRVGRPAV